MNPSWIELVLTKAYNPDQPRDEDGKWGDGGTGGASTGYKDGQTAVQRAGGVVAREQRSMAARRLLSAAREGPRSAQEGAQAVRYDHADPEAASQRAAYARERAERAREVVARGNTHRTTVGDRKVEIRPHGALHQVEVIKPDGRREIRTRRSTPEESLRDYEHEIHRAARHEAARAEPRVDPPGRSIPTMQISASERFNQEHDAKEARLLAADRGRERTRKETEMEAFEHRVAIEKADDALRIAWGWAYVCEDRGGQVVDVSGDICEAREVQKAAHAFVSDSRAGGVLHEGTGGRIVDSIFFSKAVQDALGIDLGLTGWFVGFEVADDAAWAGVQNGTYTAFSIGGSAETDDLTKGYNPDQDRDEDGKWSGGGGGGGGDDDAVHDYSQELADEDAISEMARAAAKPRLPGPTAAHQAASAAFEAADRAYARNPSKGNLARRVAAADAVREARRAQEAPRVETSRRAAEALASSSEVHDYSQELADRDARAEMRTAARRAERAAAPPKPPQRRSRSMSGNGLNAAQLARVAALRAAKKP